MTLVKKSRHIPADADKAVKKSSGFRCAWCGCYLTERHHIIPFSEDGPSTEDNLILLCGSCHTDAHKGKISRDELSKRRIELTGKVDRSSGCLSINYDHYRINAGGNS